MTSLVVVAFEGLTGNPVANAASAALKASGVSVSRLQKNRVEINGRGGVELDIDGPSFQSFLRYLVIPTGATLLQDVLLTIALFPKPKGREGGSRLLGVPATNCPKELRPLCLRPETSISRLLKWLHGERKEPSISVRAVEGARAAYAINWHNHLGRLDGSSFEKGSFTPIRSLVPSVFDRLNVEERVGRLLDAYSSSHLLQRLFGEAGRRLLDNDEILRREKGEVGTEDPSRLKRAYQDVSF